MRRPGLHAYLASNREFLSGMRAHPAYRVVALVWGAFGLASLFLPFFPHAEKWFYSLPYAAKWRWDIWVIGLLLIGLAFVYDASRRQVDGLRVQLEEARNAPTTGASWSALYEERKRVQAELDDLDAEPEPGPLRMVSAVDLLVSGEAARNKWRETERKRRAESKKKQLEVLDARLRGTVPEHAETDHLDKSAMSDTDPKLYLTVEESTDRIFIRTRFVLHNREGRAAHNAQIKPLTIGNRTLRFAPIPVILPGQSGETFPTADGETTSFSRNNLFHWIVDDWNSEGMPGGTIPKEERSLEVTVSYGDPGGREFESVTPLCLNAIAYTIDKSGHWPAQDAESWTVGAPKFRRIR